MVIVLQNEKSKVHAWENWAVALEDRGNGEGKVTGTEKKRG